MDFGLKYCYIKLKDGNAAKSSVGCSGFSVISPQGKLKLEHRPLPRYKIAQFRYEKVSFLFQSLYYINNFMQTPKYYLFQLYIILSFIFSAQSNMAQEHLHTVIPNSVRLRLIFPVDGDTINFSQVRYAGSALPTAIVWVQGGETKVYPSGAFVGLVPLEPGANQISFSVEDSLGFLSDTLHIFREPTTLTYAERPTRINPMHIKPEADVYLSPGDIFEIEFLGSPGGQAFFSIDKIAKNFKMMELSTKDTNGIRGWYKGFVRIPNIINYKPKPVEFKLKGKDRRTLKVKSKGKIHILSELLPLVGVTVDSMNLIRTKPDGEIWMELPRGIRMQIIGERDGVKKIKLAENVVGYISSASLNPEPLGTPLPRATVGSISSLADWDWVQVLVNLSERVPFKIEQLLEPSALEITFYRAQQAPQWITYPLDDETIRLIRWRQQSSDIFVLRIDLNQKQQWGYYGRYVGKRFKINIRKTPKLSIAPDSLLKGLVITVDPGHGGKFKGAISATGLQEKNVNLKYAMKVADLLQAEGATVIRTRILDTTLTLQDRITMAQQAQSHIFISLHNNSIGPATDPLVPRGTSTYYTVTHSQAIAKAVFSQLLKLGLNPYGRISSTYFVTRQTSMITFIVEGAFMTHPEDEMLLMNETFLDDLAQAVVEGIIDFVMAQLPAKVEYPSLETKEYRPTDPNF
ncbi:MAG: N-acetylmuramoyl-L-alanine amidase [bacterium]